MPLRLTSLRCEVVFEAAGGGDDEARAATDGVQLRAFVEAAADEGCRALAAGEVAVGLENLHGELARGQEDEGGGAFLIFGASAQ